ncbi:BTAD domain-containing putative transcriptional regulator [Micromonospora sp. NPDC050417]|uniref:AfsR/SARP family transcriptional regulator n=1 Tax=Micromonospora sp. NPDC050417 TaxID=3364280 RepID=UPI0037A58FE4
MEVNEPVSTDRLIDVLWEHSPPATARQQVQNCIGSLRTILTNAGRNHVLSRRANSYTLELPDNLVDGQAFKRLCHDADLLTRSGELSKATASLRKALSLWHGRALEDVHSDALIADAANLEETRVHAIEGLIELEFAQGNHNALIADLTSWVRLHPYHEGMHGRLAEALNGASRRAEALQVIHDLKLRLDTDLGIGPSPALREVEQKILGKPADEFPRAGYVNIDLDIVQSVASTLADLTATVQLLLSGHSPDPRGAKIGG